MDGSPTRLCVQSVLDRPKPDMEAGRESESNKKMNLSYLNDRKLVQF